jgi:hypothetical protein
MLVSLWDAVDVMFSGKVLSLSQCAFQGHVDGRDKANTVAILH